MAQIKAKHHRGQNFLIDKNIVDKIVASANLSPDDIVIEVGPGKGALTKELAFHCNRVIAIEVDKDLIPILEQEISEYTNITIIHGDIRRLTISEILKKADLPITTPYKIVANIPYYLTAMLIRTFLENTPRPTSLTLLIQKEVAERITNTKEASLLSLSIQFFAHAKLLFTVSKNCFRPIPKVESAVIQITLKPEKEIPSQQKQDHFFKILHAGFAAKRKYLASNLAKGLAIPVEKIRVIFKKLELDEKVRSEELSIDKWRELEKLL